MPGQGLDLPDPRGRMTRTLAEVRAQFRKATRNDVDAAILTAWGAALNSVKAREPVDLAGVGCGDNSCLVERPRGMATNGGCHCEPRALRHAVMAYRAECDRLTAELADLKSQANEYGPAPGMARDASLRGLQDGADRERMEAIHDAVIDGCVAGEGAEKLYRRIAAALGIGERTAATETDLAGLDPHTT